MTRAVTSITSHLLSNITLFIPQAVNETRTTVLNLRGCTMNGLCTGRWQFAKRWQRKEVADDFEAKATEIRKIAECNGDLIKDQYEALARQCLIIAAQRTRTV